MYLAREDQQGLRQDSHHTHGGVRKIKVEFEQWKRAKLCGLLAQVD
jgi:hypothetical protein